MTVAEGITLAPAAPWPLVVALGCVACALALRYSHGAGVIAGALRASALLGISVVLLSPGLRVDAPDESDRPDLVVLIDTSESMATCDIAGEDGPSRLESLRRRWFSEESLRAFADVATLRYATFDETVRPVDIGSLAGLEAEGHSSEIAGAVAEMVNTLGSGDHVLLLSDGASTGAGAISGAAADAVARGVAVHASGVGATDALPDVAVELSVEQERIFAGESTLLHARMTSVGEPGAEATLRLTETDESGSERIVFEGVVATDGEIELDVSPPSPSGAERMMVVYRASVTTSGTDADPRNNESLAGVLVSAAPLRVLVVEGRPSWQTRFVTEALGVDPRFDTTVLSVVGERIVARRFTAEGADQQSIDLADVIERADIYVLGRSVDAVLQADDGARIADSVLEGGRSVVFLRGDPFSTTSLPWRGTLDSLAPVRWGEGGFAIATPVVTSVAPGPVRDVLSRMRGLLASHSDSEERSLSQIWLRGETGVDSRTTIASMRAGAGMSLAVLSDGLWRWAMSASASRAAAFDEFWSLSLRSLAGEPLDAVDDVTVETDRFGVVVGDSIEMVVRALAPSPMTVTVMDAGLNEWALTDGRATASASRARYSFEPSSAGLHRVVVRDAGGQELAGAVFFAMPALRERMAVQARPDDLAALAATTGGLSLDGASVETLHDAIADAQHGDVAESAAEFDPVWDRPWVFGLISLLLLSEWVIRRLRGLP